jgi:hypothetical protein
MSCLLLQMDHDFIFSLASRFIIYSLSFVVRRYAIYIDISRKYKGAVPHHQDLMGGWGIAPPFLTSALDVSEWSVLHPGPFNPGKEPRMPIRQEAECTREPVWTLRSKEKSLSHAGNQTLAIQEVTRHCVYWAIWALAYSIHSCKIMEYIVNQI